MGEAAGRSLLLPDNVVFTCQNSGACCRSDWLIGVDAVSHARLRDVAWPTLDPALGPGEKFVPLAFPLPSGERLTFARNPAGSCVFLTSDTRCSIHRHLGAAAKPQVCREFPVSLRRDCRTAWRSVCPSPAPPCAGTVEPRCLPSATRSRRCWPAARGWSTCPSR